MKHIKRMLWVIPVGFIGLGLLGQGLMAIGVIEEPAPTPVVSKSPDPEKPIKPVIKKEAKFVGTFVRWAPASPATGTFYFMVENKGNKAGKFICFIRMSDLIDHYKGYTQIEIDQDMPLGDIYIGAEPLVISNQGALFVDQGSIDCKTK
jgi:hypothetical protein